MKTFMRMMCVAALACSLCIVRSYGWYKSYEASYGSGSQSEYVSVPSSASISIYGAGRFNPPMDYALLRVTTPTDQVNCYCYSGWEEREVDAYSQAAGTYQVSFTYDLSSTSYPSYDTAWIHYDVSIYW